MHVTGSQTVLRIAGLVIGIIIALVRILALSIEASGTQHTINQQNISSPRPIPQHSQGKSTFSRTSHCAGNVTILPRGVRVFDRTRTSPGFGIYYSRKLTPDMKTGLGKWTDGEIVQAIREGQRRDHTPLFPIMPVDWYHETADKDVLALVADLRSLPVVKNAALMFPAIWVVAPNVAHPSTSSGWAGSSRTDPIPVPYFLRATVQALRTHIRSNFRISFVRRTDFSSS